MPDPYTKSKHSSPNPKQTAPNQFKPVQTSSEKVVLLTVYA
jgi:hypothetical protein